MKTTTKFLCFCSLVNVVLFFVLRQHLDDDKEEKQMLHRLQEGSATEEDLNDLHLRSTLLVYSNLWYGLPLLVQGLLIYDKECKTSKPRLWLLSIVMVVIGIFSTLKHSFEHHSKIDGKQLHCQTYEHHKSCVAEGRCPMNDEYVYICLPYEWVTRLDWMVARQGVLVIIWLVIGVNGVGDIYRKHCVAQEQKKLLLGPLGTPLAQSANLLALLWCIVHDVTFLSRPTEDENTALMQSLGYGIAVIVVSAGLTVLACHYYLEEGQRILLWPHDITTRGVLLAANLVVAFISNNTIPNDVLHLSHVLWHMASSTAVLCAMALMLQWELQLPECWFSKELVGVVATTKKAKVFMVEVN